MNPKEQLARDVLEALDRYRTALRRHRSPVVSREVSWEQTVRDLRAQGDSVAVITATLTRQVDDAMHAFVLATLHKTRGNAA